MGWWWGFLAQPFCPAPSALHIAGLSGAHRWLLLRRRPLISPKFCISNPPTHPDPAPTPHPRPLSLQQNIQQMSRMLPPHMLKMMGGAGALQQLIKQMEGKF